MIRTGLLAAVVSLAACGGAPDPEAEFADACSAIVSDEPIVANIAAGAGATIEEYCDCYGVMQAARPEAEREQNLAVLRVVAARRAADGGDTQAAVEAIEAEIRSDPASHPFTEDDLTGAGDTFEDVVDGLVTGGVCNPG
ncbi:MAG: hypothetical protein AAFX03_11150 [Pseudomonadota bacterium]